MLCTSSGHVLMYSSIVVNCFLFIMCLFHQIFHMRSSRCLSTIEQAFSCWSLDQYSMLKRKKLLVSCSSPGLFGVPEKPQGTVIVLFVALLWFLIHSFKASANSRKNSSASV